MSAAAGARNRDGTIEDMTDISEPAAPVELAWFGVSTFRLRAGDTVIFLDA
jgi:hypothetical protein